jgi:hypothetical protein
MKGEPRIYIMCDVCEEDFDFTMTALVGGGWDDRNVESKLIFDGWSVEEDRHVCPDCVADAKNG